MMESTRGKSEEELKKERGLLDLIFSWSLSDVLNVNLYKNKVPEIPMTFSSTDAYLNSFILPLLEETRSDLHSNMLMLSTAPARQVFNLKRSKGYKPPQDLIYKIVLQKPKENEKIDQLYEPRGGDLIALTERSPKCIDDLNTPRRPYNIAFVRSSMDNNHIVVLSAKDIELENEKKAVNLDKSRSRSKHCKLFMVYLANMTTNLRIWAALNSSQQNVNIIKKVLQADCSVDSSCIQCSPQLTATTKALKSCEIIRAFDLDDSQQDAVLEVITTRQCNHQNTVKLIWGPPGTGKSKTLGSLVFALLTIKCRTLTCAPTNIAVVGVASKLMSLVKCHLEDYPYGLGDIVLFGNSERMNIDEYEGLFEVFLDNRVDILKKCFSPFMGWKSSLEMLICLLEDPKEQYRIYLISRVSGDTDGEEEFVELMNMNVYDHENKDEIDCCKFIIWYNMANQMLKKKEKREFEIAELEQIFRNISIDANHEKDLGKLKTFYDTVMKLLKEMKEKRDQKDGNVLTLEEFFLKAYNLYANRLIDYMPSLCTHLPTCLISLEVVKNMMRVDNLLKTFGTLIKDVVHTNKDLTTNLESTRLSIVKLACVQLLKIVQGTFSLPTCSDLRNLCLKNTILIFCTAMTSAKLHTEESMNIELLIIDEAAQLKECESAIPLQLPGLCHAILVGDERQLPAMVQSKICDKASFGRSLFERLVLLGHNKHLLNVQYRMHPSISQFPNKNFYDNEIKDGPNVKQRTYEKRFLKGNMFGPFSFINVTQWKEDQDNGFSRKNLLEVAVVAELVASLKKECRAKGQKVSVGCISPYKAQVFAIQDKLGNLYDAAAKSDFSVKVNSVDGFQGSEEDIIIISTVRSNGNGSIGFLSNFQRTNVALTRARYCCWVLGNGSTLINSGSVWKKLVVDAKLRGCFFNATDNENLDRAIKQTLLQLGQVDSLLKMDSQHCKRAKWKTCFSDEFVNSMKKILDSNVREKVLSLLTRLSCGWRCPEEDKVVTDATGTCSLLMEAYNVNGEFVLIWTVDIVRERSKDIQVLKVWDVLQKHKIPPLVTHLNRLFGNYTVDAMNRCQVKDLKGDLTLPMSWPVDRSLSLSSQLAGLSLRNSRGTKDEEFWNKRRQRKW